MIIDKLVIFLNGLSPEWIITIIAAMPVVELRLAIPYGLFKMGMGIKTVFFCSLLGNMLPVLPLLYLLEPIAKLLRKVKVLDRFFDWLFERTRKRSKVVEQYELLGLVILVAIPLPMTGAWTGAIAAFLFGLNKKASFWAIGLGVFIAACIVTLLTVGAQGLFPG
ncbi:MAG: small multi-drug export protein [Candidatus Omnitrophica bacterium]|nr:small multi-drug export protein [Candidatus Omnitrophota bacterium]